MWQASGLYFTIQKKTPRRAASIVPLQSDGEEFLRNLAAGNHPP